MISRDDISPEANIARRKFWEMCASRTPMERLPLDKNPEYGGDPMEVCEDVASWADGMLVEWDKRWIEADDITQANEILP